MSTAPRWRLVPHLLLRRAGFPFSLIEGLACPETARRAAEVAAAGVEAEEVRAGLLRTLFPAEVGRLAGAGDRAALRALSRWRRRVGRTRPVPAPPGPWGAALVEGHARWLEARGRQEEARRELERAFARELPAARAALRDTARAPRVREALFLLVPALLDTLDSALGQQAPGSTRAPDRALERRLYNFVQRLGSKNETTSFFGPLTHARVDASLSGNAFGPEAPGGVTRREAFAAFWAVATLGAAAAADPGVRRALPVRRIPAAGVDGERAFGPDGAEVALEAPARALFARVDDRLTAAELAGRAGLSPEEGERAVRLLERAGFVRRDLEPLSTTPYPLAELKARLPDVPAAARWRAVMEDFEERLRRFEQAGLEERRTLLRETEAAFEKACGKAARRGQGQMYADRTVLYEDCQGDSQPVRLAGSEARRLEAALTPVLELGGAYGRLRHRALRGLAAEVLEALGGRARFLAFAAELDARIARGAMAALDAEPDRFLAELTARVRAASDGRVARLAPEALKELIQSEAGPRFASPDVMLELRPDGPPRFIIGEVHPYVFAWGSQNHFAPDAGALQAAFREDLRPWGGAEQMAVVLRRRRHKGLVSDTFPGTFIEVTGRAVADPSRRVAIADLQVVRGEDGPVLRGPRGPLSLYVGEDDHPHLRAFAAPLVEMPTIRLGEHTPRIEVGDVVYQRERWELTPDRFEALCAARDPLELAVRVADARRTGGWPRFVFAMAPSEPKPLCLDLEVPFAQEHLQRLLAQGPLRLSEMLPHPERLWLQRSAGAHTSELRLGMVREP